MRRSEIIEIMDGQHPAIGRWPALILYAIIIASAVVLTLETMPDLTPETRTTLRLLEIAILAVFVVEFLTRLACAARPLAYLFSFWGIVDLLACLPALLLIAPDWQAVRALRLLRLLRLIKLFRFAGGIDRLEYALRQTWRELSVLVFLAILTVYLAAVGIYHFESRAQPEQFRSIPESLWWALATLTTVGYGDVYPVTAGGRLFTGLVLIVGLGIVAVPAGVITAALLNAPEPETSEEDDAMQNREDPP
ncbi:MAG: ion transporter [Pseudomonadota bacterium]